MNANPSNDELDLLELLANVFNAIQRNFLTIILSLVLGIALGLVYYKTATNQYTSRMLFSSTMPESYGKTQIEKLQKLISEQSPLLAGALNLSNEETRKLIRVKIENTSIRKFEIQRNGMKESAEETVVLLEVRTSDNTIWPKLTNGLINYLENNSFVRLRMDQQKKYYTQLITRLDIEIKDLELLKTKVLNGVVSSYSKDGVILMDPSGISGNIINLTKEKIEFQNMLENINSIQIIEGFTVFERPTWPNLLISVAIGIFLGVAMAITMIVSKAVRQRTRS